MTNGRRLPGRQSDDGDEERERQRGSHLDSEDIYQLKRLADSAPDLLRLAAHADNIIANAEDRNWWKGLKRRARPIMIWIGSILAAAVAALTIFDKIKPPPGTGGH